MFSAAMQLLHIKDLKDLRALRESGSYRHAGPKGPEEMFFTDAIAGNRPPRYGPGRGPLAMSRSGAGAPELQSLVGPKGPEEMFSYANDRGGQAPALRARKRFSSPCPVRERVLPNYSLLLISC